MNKEKYERVQIEVTEFTTEDVIMTSVLNPDDDYEAERAMIYFPMI